MLVLGLETSCDETAAALVTDQANAPKERVLADMVLSQLDQHRPYGGIVPEIAARAHLEHLQHLITRALDHSGRALSDIDAIAASCGPGLIGGLLVGATMGRAIARVLKKPFIAINHLEAHALTARMTDDAAFPYLLLLVSGGHCQLLICEGVGRFQRLGATIDDAVGEAFDKAAKMLGLGYPGGPAIEKAAATGDAQRFALPRPMKGKPGCDFSFSGLKTALRLLLKDRVVETLTDLERADLAASFQEAVADSLADRCLRAMRIFREKYPDGKNLVIAGGVAANRALRTRLSALAETEGLSLIAPPPKLCTDNGAMIAWAGLERLRLGLTDGGDMPVRPRWPLDPKAPKLGFAGAKA